MTTFYCLAALQAFRQIYIQIQFVPHRKHNVSRQILYIYIYIYINPVSTLQATHHVSATKASQPTAVYFENEGLM
jgi:hypothetical protein